MTVLSVMPNLYTADAGRAVAFYRDLLGGTQTFRYPGDGPAEHADPDGNWIALVSKHHV